MVIPLWRQFLAVDDGLDLQPRPQSGRLAVRQRAEFWISRAHFIALYGSNVANERTAGPIIGRPHET